MMAIFIIYIIVWVAFGLWGCMRCKDNSVNWPMFVFMAMIMFIPIVAKLGGLL